MRQQLSITNWTSAKLIVWYSKAYSFREKNDTFKVHVLV